MLEESVSDHRHERMTMKALPGSSLEVIETDFFFQMLVNVRRPVFAGRLAGLYFFSPEILCSPIRQCGRSSH